VDRPRQQLLAGAALPKDAHARIRAATRRACASKSSMLDERVMSSALQSSSSPAGGLESPHGSATVSSSTFGSKGLVRKLKSPPGASPSPPPDLPCARQDHARQRRRIAWTHQTSANPLPHLSRSPPRPGDDSADSAASPELHRRHRIPAAVSLIPTAATGPGHRPPGESWILSAHR